VKSVLTGSRYEVLSSYGNVGSDVDVVIVDSRAPQPPDRHGRSVLNAESMDLLATLY